MVRGLPRRTIAILSFTSLMLAILSNAGAADEGLAEFQRQIRVKYDMKEAAFAANDPEPILSHFYHSDVVSTGPDGQTHVGREELRPVYNEVIAGTVSIESYRSFVSGDAGWDWVNFHVTPPAESGHDPFTFKMLFLWERENGEWWSHGEMYVMGEFDIK
jgi:hypothetical protein